VIAHDGTAKPKPLAEDEKKIPVLFQQRRRIDWHWQRQAPRERGGGDTAGQLSGPVGAAGRASAYRPPAGARCGWRWIGRARRGNLARPGKQQTTCAGRLGPVLCAGLDWTGSVSSRRGERKNGGRRDAPARVVRSVRGVPTFRTGSECLVSSGRPFQLVLMLGFQINSFSSLKSLNL